MRSFPFPPFLIALFSLFFFQSQKARGNLPEEDFQKAIDEVFLVYSPIVSSQGLKLSFDRRYADHSSNAYSMKLNNTLHITLLGGLVRHPEMTKDAFSLVICHELGHWIGGPPFSENVNLDGISVEGQAEYFAAKDCLKKVIGQIESPNIQRPIGIDPYIKKKCEAAFSHALPERKEQEKILCQRVTLAGLHLSHLFSRLRNEEIRPSLTTPDPEVTPSTLPLHPSSQCRLDTYFAGALQAKRPLCWYRPEENE